MIFPFIFIPLHLIIHEFSHAITAIILGYKVNSVICGTGPSILDFDLLDIHFRFGWLMLEGMTTFNIYKIPDFHKLILLFIGEGISFFFALIFLSITKFKNLRMSGTFVRSYIFWSVFLGLIFLLPISSDGFELMILLGYHLIGSDYTTFEFKLFYIGYQSILMISAIVWLYFTRIKYFIQR